MDLCFPFPSLKNCLFCFSFQLATCSVEWVWLPIPIFILFLNLKRDCQALADMLLVECFCSISSDEDGTLLFRVQTPEAYLCLHYYSSHPERLSERCQSRLSTLAALAWKESYMGIAGDSWTPLCIFFCCLQALLGRADPHHTFLWSSSFMENYWCARLNCSMLLPPHIRRRNHTLFNSCIKSSSSLPPLCKEIGAKKRCISCTRVVLFIYSSRHEPCIFLYTFLCDLV